MADGNKALHPMHPTITHPTAYLLGKTHTFAKSRNPYNGNCFKLSVRLYCLNKTHISAKSFLPTLDDTKLYGPFMITPVHVRIFSRGIFRV